MEKFNSIWQLDDMPRNKMLKKGMASLSNSELLSILLSTGTKESSVSDLAKEIVKLAQGNLDQLGKLTIKDFQQIKGIGESKAAIILAAVELGRRRHVCNPVEQIIVTTSDQIAQYLKVTMKDLPYEVFGVLFLNRANRIKHFEIVSQGGITGTVADPRVILKKAIEHQATSLILTHNHPSGNLKPSAQDVSMTDKIKAAASYIDVRVLDHIIVSDDGYFSFADEGII